MISPIGKGNVLEVIQFMRAEGVRRIKFGTDAAECFLGGVTEVELEPARDTIPAPPLESEIEAEQKAPGMCAVPGCRESAGFHFAPHLCVQHGMGQLGVKT